MKDDAQDTPTAATRPADDLIPVAEAVRILPSCRPGKKVALSTLHRWIDEGKLDGVKIGRWTFVKRSHVLELLKPMPARKLKVSSPSYARRKQEEEKSIRENDERTRKILESFGLTY